MLNNKDLSEDTFGTVSVLVIATVIREPKLKFIVKTHCYSSAKLWKFGEIINKMTKWEIKNQQKLRSLIRSWYK